MSGTPRSQVAARKPAASPSAPPPIATSGSRRSARSRRELARRVLDDRQPLARLALRQQHPLDRPAVGREGVGEPLAGRGPGAGLRDEDRPPRPEPAQRVADDSSARDPLADDEVAAERIGRAAGPSAPAIAGRLGRRGSSTRSTSDASSATPFSRCAAA